MLVSKCLFSGTNLDNEFVVYSNILCRENETLRSFLNQPAQDLNLENNLTLELPDDVNQKVAIEFMKAIYEKIVRDFPGPNLDNFNCEELMSFFGLSDMYFLDSSKILVKQKLKKECEEKITKFYLDDAENIQLKNIPINERKSLSKYFLMALKLEITFTNFNTWDGLFVTYVYHNDPQTWKLKTLENFSALRQKDNMDYFGWGYFFFCHLVSFVSSQNDLTWEDATKKIEFCKPDFAKVTSLLHDIKIYIGEEHQNDILKNKKLWGEICLSIQN